MEHPKIEPDDAVPSEDAETPQPPPPDPDHVVEENQQDED